MEVKVSVIIPVYNAEKNLAACMDSVLSQSLKEIEVICVDDDSTDNSLSMLKQYASTDNRVKVLHQKNGGAGSARNNGLRYATGEYLSILDSDDFYELNMLEEAYLAAKAVDSDYLVFRCDHYDNTTAVYFSGAYTIHHVLLPDHFPFAAYDVKKDIFKLFIGWSWDKLIKRSLVESYHLQFQEQRTSNDLLFVFSALLQSQRIQVLDKVLVHHRTEKGSLSVTREKSWHCFHDALIALKEQMVAWNIFDRYEQDFINYSINFSLWNLKTLAEPTHSLLYQKLRKEWFDEFGVTAHDESYFYNKQEYREYKKIMLEPIEHKPSLLSRALYILRSKGLKYFILVCLNKVASKLKSQHPNA